MASDATFMNFVVDQLASLEGVSSRKMFGEYAIYHGPKVVALICGNQLFVKPTVAGRDFIGRPVEAPAHPKARPSFLIAELDDAAWLSELIWRTSEALPLPKPKPRPATKTSRTRQR